MSFFFQFSALFSWPVRKYLPFSVSRKVLKFLPWVPVLTLNSCTSPAAKSEARSVTPFFSLISVQAIALGRWKVRRISDQLQVGDQLGRDKWHHRAFSIAFAEEPERSVLAFLEFFFRGEPHELEGYEIHDWSHEIWNSYEERKRNVWSANQRVTVRKVHDSALLRFSEPERSSENVNSSLVF